jgi:hypothetical protein
MALSRLIRAALVLAAGLLLPSDQPGARARLRGAGTAALLPMDADAAGGGATGGPACEPILGHGCPKRDPPSSFGAGLGSCEGVPPTPVDGACKARVAGCAGLTGQLCPRACGYCKSLIDGARCRLGALLWLRNANEACGHSGMHDEWEAIGVEGAPARAADGALPEGPAPVILHGIVGAGGGRGCAGLSPCDGCAVPRYSARDSCFTHADRDFVFDLALGEDGLFALSPANMVSDRSHVGRDLEVEAEWMYLFPQYRGAWLFAPDDRGLERARPLPARLSFELEGQARSLAVPGPGDALAASGALVADCGHLDQHGFARTELHPALALAWAHAEGEGRYTVAVRAISHSDTDRLRYRLAPLRALLPLQARPGQAISVESFKWSYLYKGYSIAVDRSCVFAGNGDHQQERPTAHLAGGENVAEAQQQARGERPEALHRIDGFALRISAAAGGALVELWPERDESPALLAGASAEVLVH